MLWARIQSKRIRGQGHALLPRILSSPERPLPPREALSIPAAKRLRVRRPAPWEMHLNIRAHTTQGAPAPVRTLAHANV